MDELIELSSDRALKVICYPKADFNEFNRRLKGLKRHGVKYIISEGKSKIDDIHVLGKGGVGVVVAVLLENGGKGALKIRRLDAHKESLLHEAEMLKLANSVSVGPKLLSGDRDFLLMEYIGGQLIEDWLKSGISEEEFRKVVRDLLTQCYRLDKLGLDHGELTRAKKHVKIWNNKPYILDFETASANRKPRNLTSIVQYLFIRQKLLEALPEKFKYVDVNKLLKALKRYKEAINENNFSLILRETRLYEEG